MRVSVTSKHERVWWMTAFRWKTAIFLSIATIWLLFLGHGPYMLSPEFGSPGGVNTVEIIEEDKVLMVTWIFGEKFVNTRLLQLFLESGRGSGIDIAIVGHPAPKIPLPPNVRHIPVTWDDLTDRIKFRIFNGTEPGDLRQAQYPDESKQGFTKGRFYKINDIKPLFAYLFPEHVKGYDWWGQIDNDMILGNLRNFLTPDRLANSDVISTPMDVGYKLTSGAFTLYRNTRQINQLFRLAKRPLEDIFATNELTMFVEWGGGQNKKKGSGFESSMSGIIVQNRERLGIRFSGNIGTIWDGFCLEDYSHLGRVCSRCQLAQLPNGNQMLTNSDDDEVSMCHYQYSKNLLDRYLESDALMNDLRRERQFRYDYRDGFFHLNGTRFNNQASLKAPRNVKEYKAMNSATT